MINVWIKELEPIETRYTCQWIYSIPNGILNNLNKRGIKATIAKNLEPVSNVDVAVRRLEVKEVSASKTTEGAFLNFVGTNIYKSSQLATLARAFEKGLVQDGDVFVVPDAWDPTILQLRYMIELLDYKKCRIHSIWHAGSYDPHDFLGRKIEDKRWSLNAERAFFFASDKNYAATNFHINMIKENVFGGRVDIDFNSRMVRSGQPHEFLVETLKHVKYTRKENFFLFPHRIAPEKQPEIFRDLSKFFPDYKFIFCQEKNLKKDEYHKLLAKSKFVFSANLQETLGISAMEAVLVDTVPILPKRLSYEEMYLEDFFYPSEYTESFESYLRHRDKLVDHIRSIIEKVDKGEYREALAKQKEILLRYYLNAEIMYENICNDVERNLNGEGLFEN